MPPTLDQVVGKYVELRDRRADLKKNFEAEDRVLSEAQDKLGEWIMAKFKADGTRSSNTIAGTAFITTKDSVRISDWDMFADFIIRSGRVDLLEHRASKNAVKELMDQTRDGSFANPPPPGIEYVRWEEIQVNRPKKG